MAPQTVSLSEPQRQMFADRRLELALSQHEIKHVSTATVRSVENAYRPRFAIRTVARLALGLALTPVAVRQAGLPQVANLMERRIREEAPPGLPRTVV